MHHLIVGVGEVSVRLRFAQSLKDKRHILQSLSQKLRNEGFSVVESGHQDNFKIGTLGFAYAGKEPAHVETLIRKAFELFRSECEIIEKNHEVFDYEGETPEIETFGEEI